MKMMNPRYVIYHDLIGLHARVRRKDREGKEFKDAGEVVDETRNMLLTNKRGKKKKYIKKDHVFRFKLDDDRLLEVDGTKIVGRPEDRLRSLKKKRYFRN